MSGDFLALFAAVIHVLLRKNPELLSEIHELTNYYRQYIFPDGVDSKAAMEQAFELLTAVTNKAPYTYPEE